MAGAPDWVTAGPSLYDTAGPTVIKDFEAYAARTRHTNADYFALRARRVPAKAVST